MELSPTYFIGELMQALIGGVRLLLMLGIPLSILVSSLAVGAHFRGSPYSAVLRPGFKFLAYLQVSGAAIVLFIDIAGLVTASWQFKYIATSFPEVLVFVVPLGLLTAPLWLFVLRRVEPATLVSLVPHA